jgi:ACS family sodium-dependent inorganic phosphate cotransporter-like MFS transporter 5
MYKLSLYRICGSTVLGVTSVLSPLIIEYAGVPFYFATRVVQGACMVGVKQFTVS